MRIIAGEHRGRPLLPPLGEQTRPVTDRAKQSIFDTLGPRVEGAIVYDCFAGTGSFGLESLSRGAAHVTFFESHRPTSDRLRQNIATLRCSDRSTIVTTDWFAAVRAEPRAGRATILFLDPPYRYLRERPADLRAAAGGIARHVADEGLIVFRHDAADELELPGFASTRTSAFGSMRVDWLRSSHRLNADAGDANV